MEHKKILQRTGYLLDGITGRLLDSDGDQIAVSLERSYAGVPKLKSGTYTCVRGPHRLHGMVSDFETFEVLGVEGHKGILFHWGNWNKDSEGCILLGRVAMSSPKGQMITSSRDTFARFMLDLDNIDTFTLIVEDAESVITNV